MTSALRGDTQPGASLSALVTAAREAADVDWAAAAREDLPAAMVNLEFAQALLDAAKVSVAARLAGTDAAATLGWATAKDFLTAACGGPKGSGAALVRLAERLQGLPAVTDALSQGDLSRAKAEVIATQIATLPHDATLRGRAETVMLSLAPGLDATDLRRAWPGVVRELDPEGTLLGSELSLDKQERAAHRARFLSFSPDSYGGARIRGYATVEDIERIKAALIPLSAPVSVERGACGGDPDRTLADCRPGERRAGCPDPACAHDGRDPRDHGARLLDALVEVCSLASTARLLPTNHAAMPRLTVTMSLADLRGASSGDAIGRLPSGDRLSATAARRLACDAELIPAVLGSRSEVLDVGRSARLVTPGLWNALVLRDQHCTFPGCSRLPLACDAHHLVHWADGGVTALHNLILLCRWHHTLTHHSPWSVTLDPLTRRPVWTPPPQSGVRLRTRPEPRPHQVA